MGKIGIHLWGGGGDNRQTEMLSEFMPPWHSHSFMFTNWMSVHLFTSGNYCINVSDHCVLLINIHNGASLRSLYSDMVITRIKINRPW